MKQTLIQCNSDYNENDFNLIKYQTTANHGQLKAV